MGEFNKRKRLRALNDIRLAQQKDNAIRLARASDENGILQVRRQLAAEFHLCICIRHDQINPVIIVGMRNNRKVLARAKEGLAIRSVMRFGIVFIRKAVIVPVVGIDASIDALDVVRPSHDVAVAVKLDLRR